jgi:hypothetical protein
MHVLPAAELPALELQLHAAGNLPRVFEVPEALRVRETSASARVCEGEAACQRAKRDRPLNHAIVAHSTA